MKRELHIRGHYLFLGSLNNNCKVICSAFTYKMGNFIGILRGLLSAEY